jgi:hypothetical protein
MSQINGTVGETSNWWIVVENRTIFANIGGAVWGRVDQGVGKSVTLKVERALVDPVVQVYRAGYLTLYADVYRDVGQGETIPNHWNDWGVV